MWIIFAFGAALFAGLTAILAKIGIENTDSDLATGVRTGVVLIFAWLMAFLTAGVPNLAAISPTTYLFLGLSGLTTGASWICYFRALHLGDVNKVTPVDKSSIVLTMLLATLFLGESMSLGKLCSIVLIALGTFFMIERKVISLPAPAKAEKKKLGWLFYAVLSAVMASLTTILGKIGIQGVDSNLGTALRTCVVLVMAWAIIFARKKQGGLSAITPKSWLFLLLSGIATGLSWLCYYKALQTGIASLVAPIDKLSILVTLLFSRLVLGEKLSKKALLGLFLLTAGTLLLLVW